MEKFLIPSIRSRGCNFIYTDNRLPLARLRTLRPVRFEERLGRLPQIRGLPNGQDLITVAHTAGRHRNKWVLVYPLQPL